MIRVSIIETITRHVKGRKRLQWYNEKDEENMVIIRMNQKMIPTYNAIVSVRNKSWVISWWWTLLKGFQRVDRCLWWHKRDTYKVGNQMLMSANEKGMICKCKNKTVRWGNEMWPYIWMTVRTVTDGYDTSCKISSDIYKWLR